MEATQKHSKLRHPLVQKIFYGGIVIAPFFLLLLPIDFFDTGQSICVSKFLANIECYACGLTRGVMHFVHFDFSGAWAFNKLTFIVVPLLFLYWLRALFIVLNKKVPAFLDKIM
ncbi:MAG: DUF2752 domain-containing protein [Winogradskyella sp.]|uniref:DUF2752 domain-containing protein n=1 Tax=Winogradskyella sp. TaxID=1883156 RepID=UPI00385E3235